MRTALITYSARFDFVPTALRSARTENFNELPIASRRYMLFHSILRSFWAVPPSIAIFSPSVRPGVLMM
jgi:hypothetical protein